MYDMLWVKVDRLVRKTYFVKKKTPESSLFMRQGIWVANCPWKLWGIMVHTSYWLGKVGGIKIKAAAGQHSFFESGKRSWWKMSFFTLRPISYTIRDIGVGHKRSKAWYGNKRLWGGIWLRGSFDPVCDRPKSVEGDKMRSVSKTMRWCLKMYLPKSSKLSLTTQNTSSHRWKKVICVVRLNFEDFETYIFCNTANTFLFFKKKGSTVTHLKKLSTPLCDTNSELPRHEDSPVSI